MKISAALGVAALTLAACVKAAPYQQHIELAVESVQVNLPKATSLLRPLEVLTSEEKRLIQWSDAVPAKWMTESDIHTLFRLGIKFMDITNHQEVETVKALGDEWKSVIPVEPLFKDEVTAFTQELNTNGMRIALKKLTSFRTRYYKSETGAESSKWLYDQISDIAASNKNVTVQRFKHDWDQQSVIARFEGWNTDLKDELVIIGAHQDSVNMWLPFWGPSPGADDDGSGTVTIMEVFRTLVDGGFLPERPVEFHWYSAEEAGLLGSQDIAKEYARKGKKVVAMLQQDMTGYIGANGEVMGIVSDYVDQDLTAFIKKLIDAYAAIPWKDTKCGYACSDHGSWSKYGYRSAFAIESAFEDSNKYIHTTGDTIDKLSFEHMKEFAKLTVAFAVELGHASRDDVQSL